MPDPHPFSGVEVLGVPVGRDGVARTALGLVLVRAPVSVGWSARWWPPYARAGVDLVTHELRVESAAKAAHEATKKLRAIMRACRRAEARAAGGRT